MRYFLSLEPNNIERFMRGYNERIFQGGLRSALHGARFKWLASVTRDADLSSILELGCFDAKSLNYLSRKPDRYLGLDANWEGGLDVARQTWPQYQFMLCQSPETLSGIDETFSCAFCMETFEHLPHAQVPAYIEQLARLTKDYLFVTVPVEKGPVFLGKHIAKRFSRALAENAPEVSSYTMAEVFYSTIGLCSRVKRGEHKGFDYAWLAGLLRKRFRILEYSGHPFALAPRWLNFGVGIIAEPK